MSRYKLCDDVSIEYVDGNMVILKGNGDAATTNYTAKDMIEIILKYSIDDARNILIEKYEADEVTVEADMTELIESLRQKNIIEVVEAHNA